MRILFISAFLCVYIAGFSQSFFFQPHDAEDIEDVSYKGLYNTAYGTNVITSAGISNVSLSDGNAFSIELWQYLDSRQTSKSLLRLESSDTATNYMVLRLNSSAYLEVEFTNAGGSYYRDTEDEYQLGVPPQSTSGVVENRDWYHIIFTRSAGGSEMLYIDGESVTFDNVTGTFKNIYGDLDLTINNLHQTGPFRLFQKALNVSEAVTLYNNGRPLLSTTISDLQLEYTHQNDTWTGSAWTIPDGVASQDATTTGFLQGDMLPINSFDPDQRKDQRIPAGVPVLFNWFSGASYVNVNSWNRLFTGYHTQGQINPKVWYNSSQDKTYIAFTDHSGHGGNREGYVAIYDHATDVLSTGPKIGKQSTSNIDDHPAVAMIYHGGRIETAQEDIHRSPLYFRYSSDNTSFSEQIESTHTTAAYPSFGLAGGTAYCMARINIGSLNTGSYLWTKSGSTWSPTRAVVDLLSDWAYSDIMGQYEGSEKIAHLSLKRISGGNFYATALMLSSDGNLWHNIDSTYSQTVGSSNAIDDTDWENYKVYETDGTTSGQAGFARGAYYLDGKYLLLFSEYDTLTTTENKKVLYYSDGTTDWQTKNIAFLTNKTAYIVHVTGNTYDLFILENDVLSRYRTTDFFDTFTHQEEIYSGQLDLSLTAVTANQQDADEVVIVGAGFSANGLDNHLFIYVYDKTQ